MKPNPSVRLGASLLRNIDEHARGFRSRSEFVETAVEFFIAHLERQAVERREGKNLNQSADALDEESQGLPAR
jgi:Arc/MetJ-type ribon-helix-helix transcriptional regulator